MKFVEISVTIEGQELWRRYSFDDLDLIDDETFGREVADMVDSLRDVQKNEDFFREAKAGAI